MAGTGSEQPSEEAGAGKGPEAWEPGLLARQRSRARTKPAWPPGSQDRGQGGAGRLRILVSSSVKQLWPPKKKLLGNVFTAATGLKALRVQPNNPPYAHTHTRTNNGPGRLLTSHAKTIKNSIFTKGH